MKSSSQDNGGPSLDKLAEETSTLRTELALIRETFNFTIKRYTSNSRPTRTRYITTRQHEYIF